LTITAERAASAILTTDEVFGRIPHVFRFRVRDATPSGRHQRTAHSRQARYSGNPAEPPSFLAGLDLYSQRPDKGYSLADCISMQTMRREGLTEALTNDRHFEQEGFHALFRRED
jgi:hypothetical protein